MTKAIDCLVNVGFADEMHPDWMVRVKEDYFKGDDSFFASPELPELLDTMDAQGVERAILLTKATGLSSAKASSDRTVFIGFSRLKPPTPRAKRSGRSAAYRCARSSTAVALVSRTAFSTPWASMVSRSSGSSELAKNESSPLK